MHPSSGRLRTRIASCKAHLWFVGQRRDHKITTRPPGDKSSKYPYHCDRCDRPFIGGGHNQRSRKNNMPTMAYVNMNGMVTVVTDVTVKLRHLSYIGVFNESPGDLVALCDRCHADLHHKTAANDNQLTMFPLLGKTKN